MGKAYIASRIIEPPEPLFPHQQGVIELTDRLAEACYGCHARCTAFCGGVCSR